MMELVLTTRNCRKIIAHLLEQRGWSLSRISRVIGAPVEYVQRIESGKQSFQVNDVELLAKARGVRPSILLFNTMKRSDFAAKDRILYDMAIEHIKLHEDFQKILERKPAKKRRTQRAA